MPKLYQLSLGEAAQGLRGGGFSGYELARAYDQRREETEPFLRAFITVKQPELAERARQVEPKDGDLAAASRLWGMPGGVKDNICTRDLPTTCASAILKGFIPPYTATAVRRLETAGYLCAGKTNLDELAMGSSSQRSAYGPTANPWDVGRVPGGSSGGSAAAVAAGQVAFALGSDTGGSVRQPASFCGVVGFKPTYGLVSRYGLVAYASSLDQIGIFTRTVRDAALVLAEIAGYDSLDATSSPNGSDAGYSRDLWEQDLAGVRVGVPDECYELSMELGVREAVEVALQDMAQRGAVVETCSLPHMEYGLPAYRLLAAAEASSNLARLDGIGYGKGREALTAMELIRASRGRGLGEEVKRRILLGTLALSGGRYADQYLHAQRVRTLLCQDFQRALSRFDVLAWPTTPTVACVRSGAREPEQADLFTSPVNLAGLPAVSVPCGLAGQLPVGLQLVAAPFQEGRLLAIAQAYEQHGAFDSQKQGPLYRLGADFRGL